MANRPFHGLVSSRDQTLALYTEISVWFRILSDAYKKIYRNLDQMVLGRFLFTHFWCRFPKWPKWPEPLARPGAFKQSGHFLWCTKTLSDWRQRSLSNHCHRAAKQVLLVWYRQRVLGSLPRIPEVALPPHSVDNKAAILSCPKGQSIIRWYYELNQGVNHEHSCVIKIWSDQDLNPWPIHLAGQHCDYSTFSGIAIHNHVVNFLFKGNDLRLIWIQTAPAII